MIQKISSIRFDRLIGLVILIRPYLQVGIVVQREVSHRGLSVSWFGNLPCFLQRGMHPRCEDMF